MSLTDDILMHYGMPRRSGRYPWGSGDNPYQHSGDFLSRVEELKKSNFTFTDKDGKTYTGEVAIAKSMGLSTTQFRTQMSLAKDERRSADVATAKALRAKGYSLNEIADKMGFANDSSVRSLLNESSEARMNQAKQTAEFLKKQISEKGMIDVGTGVERELGISKEKMNQALYILEMEGYPIYGGGVPQVTNPGKQTNIKVLCPPGTEHKEIYNFENVHSVRDYVSHDDGETFDKFVYPKSMDSSRLKIRYAEDGGIQKDGVIEIRRGVDDLSLGDSHYAQVRILVDGNRYLKGMAVYSDDLPDGVDVMFNTNKKKGTPTSDVLKKVKDDPDNPFGSLIKAGGQSYYIDADGKRQLSLINKRAEEGDWGEWADKLPSQFLSKQSLSLVNKQLNLAASDKMAEFDEICSLTNPTVKKSLLKSFADDCDSAAVHLQAAALPRQKYQVILPITSMKDNEVYAPNYKNGETVALVRYPHGGTFEIPILTVNNKQAEARRILGNTPKDAIGINSKVAERLSGADFDGDTVMVIPCNSGKSKVKITSTPPLKGLEGFDPKLEYVIDEQSGSGKLDLIIQLPYVIKTEARRQQAENRRKDIENQLSGSKYGIAYTDGTEHITQLNRSVNNNLMSQIEYLTSMLYSQLGITQSILDGTADEKTMLNYNNRTIEPIISAIVDEMKRKFLTKTARSQHQSISFFRDPFKLVPVNDIAEIADKFTRNEIMTSNEIRQVVGMKPSEDPRADELRNKNLSAPSGSDQQSEEMPITEVNSAEESASDLDDKISKQKSKK